MSSAPPSGPEAVDRTEPELGAGDRASLQQWLDYHRATLRLKCAGLDDDQLKRHAVPPSTMSLLGLVRHLTEVEQGWFARTLAGQEVTPPYSSPTDPDGDFDLLDDCAVAEVWAAYDAAVQQSRKIVATFDDLDAVRRGPTDRPYTVRWVLTHLLEEYARHNGHADLLREAVDGTTGE